VTYPVLRVAPAPYARVMVDRNKDACIEGLPRCANTFGGITFLERNPGVRLAHHMHVPMQFERSVRLGVPCAVLIREPLGNLTSLVIAGDSDLSHGLALRVYLHYNRRVAALCDQVALCTFDEVLDDPAIIARRLNARFGTDFDGIPVTTEEKQRIVEHLSKSELEVSARAAHGTVPNEYKERLKPGVREQLTSHPLLPAARELYATLAARATS
jgi:hypothetical protein